MCVCVQQQPNRIKHASDTCLCVVRNSLCICFFARRLVPEAFASEEGQQLLLLSCTPPGQRSSSCSELLRPAREGVTAEGAVRWGLCTHPHSGGGFPGPSILSVRGPGPVLWLAARGLGCPLPFHLCCCLQSSVVACRQHFICSRNSSREGDCHTTRQYVLAHPQWCALQHKRWMGELLLCVQHLLVTLPTGHASLCLRVLHQAHMDDAQPSRPALCKSTERRAASHTVVSCMALVAYSRVVRQAVVLRSRQTLLLS